jgi:hypothetical protein
MREQAPDNADQAQHAANWPEPPLNIKQFLMYLIKPTAMGVAIFVLAVPFLFFECVNCTVITQQGSYYEIDWVKCIVMVLCSYLLANGISNLIVHFGKKVRMTGLYFILALLFTIISLPAAIITSKNYWGYYFTRPEVLPELRNVKRVNWVVPVETVNSGGVVSFNNLIDYSYEDAFIWAKRTPYYNLDSRNLILFVSMGLILPELSRLPPEGPDYYALVRDTGIFVSPDPGYKRSALLRGLIISAIDSEGRELVLIAANGGELSNDHYPYYELLFEKQPGTGKFALLSSQYFFFDVAGIEGLEWYFIWFVYSMLGGYVALPLILLTALGERIIRRLGLKLRPPTPTKE